MNTKIWQELTEKLRVKDKKTDKKNTNLLVRFWMQGTTFNSVNNYNDYTEDYCSNRKKNPQIKNTFNEVHFFPLLLRKSFQWESSLSILFGRSFWMFLSPIKVKRKRTDYHHGNENQNNTQSLHYFLSPFLLKYIPTQNVIANDNQMRIRRKSGNFTKNSLAKNAAKIILEKSKKVIENLSLWLSSNFMLFFVIQHIKSFVKSSHPVTESPSYPVTMSLLSLRSLRRFFFAFLAITFSAAICVFSASPAYSQESSADSAFIKTKIKELKHKDPAVRIQAVKELGKAGKSEAVPNLLELLKKDKNVNVRANIAGVFAYISDKSVSPKLIEHLKTEKEPNVKSALLLTLGHLGDKSAIPVLKQYFVNEEENLGVRLRAGDSLSNFSDEEVFNVLKEALADKNPKIRCQALASLGNILSDYKLGERIRIFRDSAENDPDEKVRKTAKFNLEKLGIKE